MVTFQITSDREIEVGGIGIIPAGETVTVTPEQVKSFQAVHGYKLAEANFPHFVQLVASTEEEGGE